MTGMLKKIKENLFLILIVLCYAVMFFTKPQMGILAVKNSGYYLKEMLLIMPVIFILTALLDTWVPKETIMKFLGQESKFTGTVLSFALGAVSAGPIYAAFPICVMLHKKGATIKNIIIILSSWAVIKIPMLLNEMKFLGPKFMVVRWVLTVIAILIFSWIAFKIVNDDDLTTDNGEGQAGLSLNQDACMGCSLCVREYSELFEMKHKKASIKKHNFEPDKEKLRQAINGCPVKAIEFTEK